MKSNVLTSSSYKDIFGHMLILFSIMYHYMFLAEYPLDSRQVSKIDFFDFANKSFINDLTIYSNLDSENDNAQS